MQSVEHISPEENFSPFYLTVSGKNRYLCLAFFEVAV
jgi:hypothetical protein